jgi:hypothetical protein
MCSNNCADILRIIDAYVYIDSELEYFKKYNYVIDHRINK